MATAEDIRRRIGEHLTSVQKELEECMRLEEDYQRLQESDVLPVGTHIVLLKNWNTDANRKKSPGWAGCLHFMHPCNPAKITSIHCYNKKVGYNVRFYDQKCYYSFPVNDKPWYILDNVFHFKREDFRVITEKEALQLIEENR